MPLFNPADRTLARALSDLAYGNPFLSGRIDAERAAPGGAFVETDAVWSMRPPLDFERPNLKLIHRRVLELTDTLRQRLLDGRRPASPADATLYEDVVLYRLYAHHWECFQPLIDDADAGRTTARKLAAWNAFVEEANRYLAIPGVTFEIVDRLPLVFAIAFQIRRAFHFLFSNIVGSSPSAARLRAGAWQSIFTCDMRRYSRGLYDRMEDITTLITGPSGTGKELVARAIGLSRYIPFDPKTRTFSETLVNLFDPVNLSALSPTLIESELFGHRRGAFTGAVEDHAGWLETCPPRGTVFLDEIGELDGRIQIKLLRVLQGRSFQRLGDTKDRRFSGKIIAATNRDLAVEMQEGRFRTDFYYRLCSDIITTPPLAEQLRQTPRDRRDLVLFIAYRLVGDEAEGLTDQVERWISEHLPDYTWPGNFRELEQCVRNILIRQAYHPTAVTPASHDGLLESIQAGRLSADALLNAYCRHVHAATGSYVETARRLGLDRRTVKARIEAAADQPMLH